MNKSLHKNIQIVILAGGKGTRLSKINKGLPKPLTPVVSVPIIEHQIRFCKSQGFSKFLIVLSFKGDEIINHFKKNPIKEINIDFFKEISPKGTGGALLSCSKYLEDYFFVIYSDTYFTVNFSNFIQEFERKLNTFDSADGLILVHPNNHPQDSDLVELDKNNKVISIHGYPIREKLNLRNLVNAAFYLLSKNLIEKIRMYFKDDDVFDIAKDIFPLVIKKGFNIFGLKSSEYIKDMGTPNRLLFLEKILKSGKLTNISPGIPKKVVLIDRDGCINKEKGRITNINDLELIDGSAEGIRNFNNSALPVFCITNQPVIARGDINEEQLENIHANLDLLLGEEGAFLDDIYYCPHHPDRGFENEIKKLKITCGCRKPSPGLIFKAAQEHNINISKSWLIGDTTTDISAGKKIGIKTILLKTGYAGHDLKEKVKPDYIFDNLKVASKWITREHQVVKESILKNIHQIVKKNIIFISGFNHIGKSHFAQVLKETLDDLGFMSHTINTDNWLSHQSAKFPLNKNLENYDIDKLINFIKAAINKDFPIYFNHTFKLPGGKNISNISETFYDQSILIIEGPPLVKIFKIFKENSLKIFKRTNLEVRKEILKSKASYLVDYYQKNINLLEDIEKEDNYLISNYLKYADIDINLSC